VADSAWGVTGIGDSIVVGSSFPANASLRHRLTMVPRAGHEADAHASQPIALIVIGKRQRPVPGLQPSAWHPAISQLRPRPKDLVEQKQPAWGFLASLCSRLHTRRRACRHQRRVGLAVFDQAMAVVCSRAPPIEVPRRPRWVYRGPTGRAFGNLAIGVLRFLQAPLTIHGAADFMGIESSAVPEIMLILAQHTCSILTALSQGLGGRLVIAELDRPSRGRVVPPSSTANSGTRGYPRQFLPHGQTLLKSDAASLRPGSFLVEAGKLVLRACQEFLVVNHRGMIAAQRLFQPQGALKSLLGLGRLFARR